MMINQIEKCVETIQMLKYRNIERCLQSCSDCRLCAQQWSCPPLSDAQLDKILKYQFCTLYVNEIDIPQATLITDSEKILTPIRREIEAQMLAQEKQCDGMASATIGRCTLCNKCTRPAGLPCRHPDMVRPSLEALGFDVGAILLHFFQIELQWSQNEFLPSPLRLITAIFHN